MTTFQMIVAVFGMITASITAVWTTIQITDFMRKQREPRQGAASEATPPAGEGDAAGRAADAAPEATPAAPIGNLPRQLTSFIGRERERAEVARLLESTRLLTLTGPGGTGKSRLALEVGRDLRDRYADGVWLVELAALRDEALVPQAVAAALGLAERSERPLMETLREHLRAKSLLLILDISEHPTT